MRTRQFSAAWRMRGQSSTWRQQDSCLPNEVLSHQLYFVDPPMQCLVKHNDISM